MGSKDAPSLYGVTSACNNNLNGAFDFLRLFPFRRPIHLGRVKPNGRFGLFRPSSNIS